MQYPSLATDPKYATNQLRVQNRIQLYHLIYNYMKQYNFKDLYKLCLEREIPIGKIRDLKEVFELPEAKAMINKFTFQKTELQNVSGIAFKFLS